MKKIKKEVIVVKITYKKVEFEISFEEGRNVYNIWANAKGYGVKYHIDGTLIEYVKCDLDRFIDIVMANKEGYLYTGLDIYIEEQLSFEPWYIKLHGGV